MSIVSRTPRDLEPRVAWLVLLPFFVFSKANACAFQRTYGLAYFPCHDPYDRVRIRRRDIPQSRSRALRREIVIVRWMIAESARANTGRGRGKCAPRVRAHEHAEEVQRRTVERREPRVGRRGLVVHARRCCRLSRWAIRVCRARRRATLDLQEVEHG